MIALQVLCALMCTVLCKCHFGGLKSVALSEWLADTAYDEVHDDNDDDEKLSFRLHQE